MSYVSMIGSSLSSSTTISTRWPWSMRISQSAVGMGRSTRVVRMIGGTLPSIRLKGSTMGPALDMSRMSCTLSTLKPHAEESMTWISSSITVVLEAIPALHISMLPFPLKMIYWPTGQYAPHANTGYTTLLRTSRWKKTHMRASRSFTLNSALKRTSLAIKFNDFSCQHSLIIIIISQTHQKNLIPPSLARIFI